LCALLAVVVGEVARIVIGTIIGTGGIVMALFGSDVGQTESSAAGLLVTIVVVSALMAVGVQFLLLRGLGAPGALIAPMAAFVAGGVVQFGLRPFPVPSMLFTIIFFGAQFLTLALVMRREAR
jgi:hypothetical protein